jgi:hypothetical protein
MSKNVRAYIAGIVGRRYGRLAFIISVLLTAVLCSPSKPGPNHCPHSPQPPPIDAFDPWIRIISPNGGEVFHVGDQCTLKVRSRYPVSSTLVLVNIGGKSLSPTPAAYVPLGGAPLPGDSAAGAAGDSTINAVIFTVPDSFSQQLGGNVYGVSDECLITINAYAPPYYGDTSNCYFSIVK